MQYLIKTIIIIINAFGTEDLHIRLHLKTEKLKMIHVACTEFYCRQLLQNSLFKILVVVFGSVSASFCSTEKKYK